MAKALAAGEFKKTDDSLDAEMYLLARQVLTANGYEHYEISNFARKGYQSRHNRLYWEFKPYLGVGAGSHSFIPPERFWNHADLFLYMEKLGAGELPVEERIELTGKNKWQRWSLWASVCWKGYPLSSFMIYSMLSLTEYYAREIEKLAVTGSN